MCRKAETRSGCHLSARGGKEFAPPPNSKLNDKYISEKNVFKVSFREMVKCGKWCMGAGGGGMGNKTKICQGVFQGFPELLELWAKDILRP